MTANNDHNTVLDYWFGTDPAGLPLTRLWFSGTAELDAELAERFGALHAAAASGELSHWEAEPQQALALVVLLDQFSRNLGRGSPAMFAHDDRAQALADRLLTEHAEAFSPARIAALALCLSHAEDVEVVRRAERVLYRLTKLPLTRKGRKSYKNMRAPARPP